MPDTGLKWKLSILKFALTVTRQPSLFRKKAPLAFSLSEGGVFSRDELSGFVTHAISPFSRDVVLAPEEKAILKYAHGVDYVAS